MSRWLWWWLPLILACGTPSDDDDSAGEEPESCPEGTLEDGGACVPEECGTGTWGGLPTDDGTLYVDASAGEGGDGSRESPFCTIQEGLAALDGGGLVAVAAGNYEGSLQLDRDQAGVHLAGRCAALVVLDADGVGPQPGILVEGGFATDAFEISGLTLTGATEVGLWFETGSLALHDMIVADSTGLGVLVFDGTSTAELERVEIRDTVAQNDGTFGYGINAYDGATVTVRDSVISGNVQSGVLTNGSGTELTLIGTEIRGNLPDGNNRFGMGISAYNGSTVTAEACLLEANTEMGVIVEGATVQLTGVTIRGTRTTGQGHYGQAVLAQAAATVQIEGCTFEDNTTHGVFLHGAGTVATVSGTTIVRTQSDGAGEYGSAIAVEGGAELVVTGGLLEHNHSAGVYLHGAGTSAQLSGVEISETLPEPVLMAGRGIEIQAGATLDAESCVLRGNSETGLAAFDTGTTVVLQDVEIRETTVGLAGNANGGLMVLDGAALTATDCLLEANEQGGVIVAHGATVIFTGVTISDTLPTASGEWGRAIEMQTGGQLEATDCLLEGANEIGLLAVDPGTVAALSGVEIRSTGRGTQKSVAVGAVSQNGALIGAEELQVAHTEGPGIMALAGTFACHLCTLNDNGFAGAVLAGGSLQLSECQIYGNVGDAGIGGGVGVFTGDINGSGALELVDSTVEAHPRAAVWLADAGDHQIIGNSLAGGAGQLLYGDVRVGGDAVMALGDFTHWDGQSGLLLQGNHLYDSTGSGVMLHGATATLVGNTYATNTIDVTQQACESVVPPEGLEEAPISSICEGYDMVVQELVLDIDFDRPETSE